MKLRHAAALALVGWYLMVPPSTDEGAPLGHWKVAASYDSASACEEALHKGKDEAQADYQHPSAPPSGWKHSTKDWLDFSRWTAQRFLAAQCIATDDPRLKEK
jgi:hypothetical protein